jgi:hypothetical protein
VIGRRSSVIFFLRGWEVDSSYIEQLQEHATLLAVKAKQLGVKCKKHICQLFLK